MALKQTKKIEKRITRKRIEKKDLAKMLDTTIDTINKYILGEIEPPSHIAQILPHNKDIVNVEFIKEVEVPKYKGVYYNALVDGDKTFYITYKEIETSKKVFLKIGLESEGFTESYCEVKRRELLPKLRIGEIPKQIKSKRKAKNIKTFDMIAEMYHKDKEFDMSKRNLKYSKAFYKNHIKPFIGNKDIETITTDDIDDISRQKKNDYANTTINHMVEKVSSIFNFAIKKEFYKGGNPARGAKKLKENNERTRFLSLGEINQLIDVISDNDTLYLFVVLSLSTGGRLNTICNIKIKDINLETMFVQLRDFKSQSSYKGFIKNDSKFLAVLKRQMQGKGKIEFLLGRESLTGNVRYIENTLPKFFKKLFNQHINEDKATLTAEELAENRREKVVIHTLRHTFASQLVINNVPIYTVKVRMNHKDIKQTMRYAKLAPDSGRDNVDNLF
ncbi:tyrosine-type recombinase/integrase [Sulfurovum sp. CS9]|uniref:tyrosine-type recombinase/integrase n=1 Tax=Sulfurovum sp. CS9 TaxID=3391146 RepID=UPI0039E7AADF